VRLETLETQETMSRKTGIGLRAYRRLENGQLQNPPIRYLVNASKVLGVPLEEICEPEWLEWTVFDVSAPDPPASAPGRRHSGR
jgi:transcriptional regulator with XRE-family HTH domain